MKFLQKALTFACIACCYLANAQNKFVIHGTIDEPRELPLIIFNHKDTFSANISNSVFTITGSVDHPQWFTLKIPDTKCGSRLYLENSNIKISLHVMSNESSHLCVFINKVEGSVSDSLVRSYSSKRFPKGTKPNPKEVKNIITEFVQQHPDFNFSAEIVYQHRNYYGPEWTKEMFALLKPSVLETQDGKLLQSSINQADADKPGSQFIPFTMKDHKGQMFNSNSMLGKYVLYEFWASWCGPCRQENPNLLANYNKYHSKGFEIVSISLDDSLTRWTQAIEQDKLPWLQVSDLKGFRTPLSTRHFINAIPYNILVDPSGKIVATKLRGDQLNRVLSHIFKK